MKKRRKKRIKNLLKEKEIGHAIDAKILILLLEINAISAKWQKMNLK